VVDQLYRKGYTVRGTARNVKDTKAVHLQSLYPNLQLFEADLQRPGSFAAALDGARWVFHVASPVGMTTKDPVKNLIEPAVQGTTDVVKTALRTPSVERIIVTSSLITIVSPTAPAGRVYSEHDWNEWTVEQNGYAVSKLQAERAAWRLVDAHNAEPGQSHPVRLITVLPAVVLGPPIGDRVDGVSVNNLTNLLNGSQVASGYRTLNAPDVDVRDVAAVHVAAAEHPDASGRYLASHAEYATPADYVRILHGLFPKRELPNKPQGAWMFHGPYTVDNSRSVKELGIKYISQQQMVEDSVAKLTQMGLITKD
jgi:nucleoside-diphosphate-sugar epimerase